ncbi:hypothetical protein DFR29_106132 [Tahibacter aquaticus]|jgi:hypothetical protein|uniref:Uncharacterized protein n=1 Tax=Tahibacter aquaticus TaxID=520092 RepID=A0A4R6YYA6_9GAMM|nr:hypothetical protein [Tahibacter aquaticus]TDR43987.1 hypothetical protein DFR29_106132 [Tahibacter aquaticus]
MDKLWYKSLTLSNSAYRLVSGSQCNTAAVVDGSGSTNWYTMFFAADDNDGNLANGTPNACRIWGAFSAHDIACGTRPTCNIREWFMYSSPYGLVPRCHTALEVCRNLS